MRKEEAQLVKNRGGFFMDKPDKPEDLPAAGDEPENLITSADIIKGEICKDCGFRCIQGCV